MRPVIEKERLGIRHIVFAIIIIICVISIGITIYLQFFQDEKLGVIFGITSEKEDTEYKNLQDNFLNIFDNKIDTISAYSGNVEKIRNEDDIILQAYDRQEQNEYYTLDLKIPYFNINTVLAKQINQEIKSIFLDKSEDVISSNGQDNIIYNVKYKAYINQNILSLIILSELKEGTSSERIIIQTYNYNLDENKKATIEEFMEIKGIDIYSANSKIKEEVNKSQEQNIKLAELGYNVNVRDVTSETYQIQNAEQYFLGQNGYLFVVYPYGNNEFTSEIDLIIFR